MDKKKKNPPELCPICGCVLEKDIVKLAEGGFIYLDTCGKNPAHYRHYRDLTLKEIGDLNP